MGYTMKTNTAHRLNYGAKRNTSSIKYIVIHYTGNDGDSDESNAKYFKSARYVSAHYFVDDDSITQSVPDNYIAYAVGGAKYSNCSTTGGGKYYNKCTNNNSISIELCDCVKDGKVYPNKGTIENALAFTKTLMKKYNIPKANVIRHFDVNGKGCPAYWCGTTAKDNKWKTEFWNKLDGTTSTTTTTSKSVAGDVYHRVYTSKWLSWVKNYGSSSNGYSGVIGTPLKAFQAYVKGEAKSVGHLEYRMHKLNGGWTSWQVDKETNTTTKKNYCGDGKSKYDGIQFRVTGVTGRHVKYRVHVMNKGWLDFVKDYGSGDDGYAGWLGYAIDAVQVDVI